MVEVTIYFHHGGEWLTSPEPHYDKGWVHYWKGYDPDLISFIDLVNEYTDKLGFFGVQELIVLAPTGKYFEIIGTNYSESEDDSNYGMEFSCTNYDTAEIEYFVTKKKRTITDSLQDDKEIVKGMAFKDIAEANQFCKLYALAKKDKLQSDPKYMVKEMKDDLHRVFKLNVSEARRKRSEKEILESLEGSFVDSSNKLDGYVTELRSCNPGSDIVIDLFKEGLSNGKRKFVRIYIYFMAMKLGFKFGLRPLIGLDGTFLKGKAKGHVLCDVSQDSNNYFYPLAWAVVDKETKRTWTWFMQQLQHSLELQIGEGLTFISDMEKGLLEAVRTVLPEAYQRYCARNIEANWCKIWGKGELKKLLWWAAWSSFA
ncbi:hypothetical protein KY290_021352 [Solanum tuberosum]|uniref:MULE transposase domain-containing protein n=1 Tax=Solanum tuberosum TaxID=4113 RepID=A0ABQ7V1A9_SOLTU|nr:hypothetical protein KY289_020514 [Solanum tuberosum]KAH0693176.1 hypothetical protein KY285_020273 [Solanum tuberosum]KAH0757859.1 hypothetical protein KY290_021352 [Solanum tuberosum]